jgi:transcriptional regulator with XRE-family HTH domain
MADHSRPKRYTNWYLRDWMRTLHVRQADLVEKTDLNTTAVSLLCNDRQDYSPAIIRDVARAMNIAPYELLMHPEDAMALRQLRRNAVQVVETSKTLDSPREATGTGG